MNDSSLYDSMSQTTNTSYSQDTQSSTPLMRFWSNSGFGNTSQSQINKPDFLSGGHQELAKSTNGGQSYYNRPEMSQIVTKSQLNVHAPSYIPSYAKDVPTLAAKPEIDEQECKALKVEMILKDQIIKNLTEQLTMIDNAKSKQVKNLSYLSITSLNQTISVPQNHYQLFQDLSKTLQEKTLELEETKERLDALMVAISMAGGANFTQAGHFDEQELAHKIVSRLQLLKRENDSLLKILSYGNKSSLLVELGLLRNENKVLSERLRQFEL